ncbi:MAG: sterol desaturase family protein [Sphingobacteriaceae bacterium]|nr:sterol desaturase family protein [Sphingobacteriaceae bacterium]
MMEGVTWLTHKFVMHGFLWTLHQDHHYKDHDAILEKNDLFFLIFSIPAITLFAIGTYFSELRFLIFIGGGITLYGMAYFIVHEIIIHQRISYFTRINNFYFRAIRKAHKIHHKKLGKEHGECFGMLLVPLKYFKEALKTKS